MESKTDIAQKLRHLFSSPALARVFEWSGCVHARMVWICILQVMNVLCSLGITLVTKELIDAAVSSRADALWKYGTALAVMTLAGVGLYFLVSLLRVHASAELQRSMQSRFARSILRKTYAGLRGFHSGELVNRVFSDTAVVKSGVLSILPNMVSTAVSFLGATTILVLLDWRFVLLLSVAGLAGLMLVILFRKPMKVRHKKMQKAADGLHSIIQESFENIRLIKASLSEKRIFGQIDIRQQKLEKEQIRQGKYSAVMNNGIDFMFELTWLLCMLWGCAAIFRGELTYGTLGAMIQLIGRVQGPIATAASIAGEAYRVISSAERLMELTDLPEENPGEPLSDFEEIELKEVSFRYDDESDEVLHRISGRIHKGDFVALTGISGGGKTSLFYLLLGIYAPSTGKILFHAGASDVEACRGTRNLFAYVPQGNTLFSGTLKENLTMFTDDATEEEIREAVRAACIEDLVAEVGLDTEIGEHGAGLSEGQAQRVAVARALLTKAPILLLDESTSALDEKTEAEMLANLSRMRDKTCLIVTHRRAALSICDYRLHLADGKMTKEPAMQPENGSTSREMIE